MARVRGSRGGYRERALPLIAVSLSLAALATPAASAAGTQTATLWVPLVCQLGTVSVQLGAALTATLPTSVPPGSQFELGNAELALEIPAAAQNALAFAFANPTEGEGLLTTFDANVSNAIAPTLASADTSRTDGGAGTWGPDLGDVSSDPDIGNPTASPAVINLVAAEQPPNADAPSPLDPLINGPSPIAGFDPGFPETPLEGGLSWGPVVLDPSGRDGTEGGNPTTNAYAPVPGPGGVSAPSLYADYTLTAGPADLMSIGPLEVTGDPGTNVALNVGDPAQVVPVGRAGYELALNDDMFFLGQNDLLSEWSADTPTPCGVDTSSRALPSPSPTYLPIATGIPIPVAGVPGPNQVVPASGPPAGGGVVTVLGDTFAPGDTVAFGGIPATNVSIAPDGDSLTATAPPGVGAVDVTVTDPARGTLPDRAQFTYGSPPSVTSMTPAVGPPGGGTAVTIVGAGFEAGDTVSFGPLSPAPHVVVNSPTSLTATIPPGTGVVDVTVTGPTGTSAVTAADEYTYVLRLDGVAPSYGPAAGGNTVTIAGDGFLPGDTVSFGGVLASNVVVLSPTSLTATVPPGVAYESVPVTVGDAAGDVSTPSPYVIASYLYEPPPTVTAVSPASGPAGGGNVVTISGNGFATDDSVSFGSTPATDVSQTAAATLTATAPPGTGTVDVTVTDPRLGSSATSSADQYSYVQPCAAAPSVTTQPTNVTVTVGQSATFTAAGSTPANCSAPAVQWQASSDGGATWTDVTGATSASLTLGPTTPAQSGYRYRATFSNAAGSADSAAATLTVRPINAPVVNSVTPGSGGPFSLTLISGRYLARATGVTFGGHRAFYLPLGGGLIIALAPPGVSGTVDVQVTTRIATSLVSSADRFIYS